MAERAMVLALLCLLIPGLSGAMVPEAERQALIALYHATSPGSWGWSVETGWLGGEGTECSWYGVTCDPEQEHVLQLRLIHNHLDGPVPPEIGDLTRLSQVDLSDNMLTLVPPEIGRLGRLTVLDLDCNWLTGVPPEIGSLDVTTLDWSVASKEPLEWSASTMWQSRTRRR